MRVKGFKSIILQMAKERQKALTREDIRMAKKHMKRCSMSLVIREKQTKTIIRYHVTPTRMAKIKITDNMKYWPVCRYFFKNNKMRDTDREREKAYMKTSSFSSSLFQAAPASCHPYLLYQHFRTLQRGRLQESVRGEPCG